MSIFGPNLDDLSEPWKWPWPDPDNTKGEAYISALRQRGDTYRRRALALLQLARDWHRSWKQMERRSWDQTSAYASLATSYNDVRAQLAAAEATTLRLAAENAKLRGLLGSSGMHIRTLHACFEDELTTEQAIGLDPILAEIDAALAHGQPGAATEGQSDAV